MSKADPPNTFVSPPKHSNSKTRFTRVELRTATAAKLIFLDLNIIAVRIPLTEVEKRFGKDYSMDSRFPCRVPANVNPLLYEFKRPWGKLVFEFPPDKSAVRSINFAADL